MVELYLTKYLKDISLPQSIMLFLCLAQHFLLLMFMFSYFGKILGKFGDKQHISITNSKSIKANIIFNQYCLSEVLLPIS